MESKTPYNTRSRDMWRIISKAVNVKDKTILDVGFGGADIMISAYESGAANVFGIDFDPTKVARLANIIFARKYNPIRIQGVQVDADSLESAFAWQLEDIIFCTSVLPYLNNPAHVLRWIRKHGETAILEFQGAEDGPGFDWFLTPVDAMLWLKTAGGWGTVENLGYTVVKGRNKNRYIFKCED